ncbi:DEAD/DEAH box helicase [Aquihabitans sp. McL0605]|uniref:DEAD/DEAH box helicase n=1 Tax=Aquihabitans sp. McL0605 TaxID=3415671 RepID=UPI003CF27763
MSCSANLLRGRPIRSYAAPVTDLGELVPKPPDGDAIVGAFFEWVEGRGLTMYPHQEEALLEVVAGSHVIVDTPTGSGKSLIATAAHFTALAEGRRTYYTAPIKALVSEKFFEMSATFGAERVGMLTGDASVNPDAPIICCTAEILANLALREGPTADVGQVVMDEFHYFADPDRGWAWQVPLLELPDAQFILMSATLGDVTRFTDDLPRRTGREVAVVRSATRPIPLVHEFRMIPLTETIEELLTTHQAPVYVVHFTQASAVERAQSLMSINLLTRPEKDEVAELIGDFRFAPGFGKTLSKFVRHGIGVHHAGMLPKYRRLVERLAQAGLLKVICGTDTLGVGINVPIRTVVFTALAKYDGTSTRLLSAREFHQIGGRAGRAGFDTMGTVIALAPDHVIENHKAAVKAAARTEQDKKVRKLVKKKPPPGQVSWGQPTFDRLVAAPPEPLTSSFTVSHAMLLNVLDRPGDGRAALHTLLTDNYETETKQAEHVARAEDLFAALLDAGVVEELDEPDDWDRTVRVTIDLQQTFALNQPLAPFALAALDLLDPESDTYALDMISIIEAVLDDPRQIISAQLFKAKGEAVAAMKAEGMEYDERMAALDEITHPKPLAELLDPMFEVYRQRNPWVSEHPLQPKSVARDLWERAMDFGDYIRFYNLARSEGTVLRYLSDAYKALARTIPEDRKTDELVDITEWLGELVRQVDSSLLDEWAELRDPADPAAAPPLDRPPPALTANRRAFTVLVRNAMFQRVEHIGTRQWQELEALDGDDGWDAQRWFDAMAPYFAEHGTIGIGSDARNPALLVVDETPVDHPGHWRVAQILHDPADDHDWRIEALVDLAASDEAGRAVVHVTHVGPHT